MSQQSKSISLFAVISAMFLWAGSFIWSKLAFETYEPFTVLLFRLSIAGISLLLIGKLFRAIQRIEKKDWKVFLLLSFFEPFLYFVGENLGLKLVSPTVASIIISTIPLFLPFVGVFFLKERIIRSNIIGVIISISGVLAIIVDRNFNVSASTIGILLLLLAVFAALGYTVILKSLSDRYNPITIVTWQNIIASFAFLPFFLFFDFNNFKDVGIFQSNFVYILLLAFLASNGAFLLYTYAIRYFGVSKIGIYTNLIPIFAMLLSYFIYNEQIDTAKLLGVVLVILGLLISEKRWFK
ncbi:MAG: DMT family transporter [Bacteroidales bacterium]|nr:DMT family transporter [Bacteroidales bacterium]